MRVCFYVLLFSFRQLSQQLQLTAVIKADAADGDLPFYSLQTVSYTHLTSLPLTCSTL